ncbi:MAG: hypothetical protein JOZ47_20600 [Kutzneria sp.]|nr:hypothetical protein [Kutzneria sp.]
MTNYTGLGAYPQPQPALPRRRTVFLVTALSVTAVVLIAIGTVVIVVRRPVTVQGVARPAVANPMTTKSLAPLDSHIPGWQTVVTPQGMMAYDVPRAQWIAGDSQAKVAIDTDPPLYGFGVAEYLRGYCPNKPDSWRALSLITNHPTLRQEQAAPEVAAQVAKLEWTPPGGAAPQVAMEPPKTLPVDDGMKQATIAIADITVHDTDSCGAKTAKVYVSAVSAHDTTEPGSALLVLLTDQGIPDAVGDDDAMKILASERLAK